MNTYELVTVGKRDDTGTVLYNTYKNNELWLEDKGYSDSYDAVLAVLQDEDTYKETCGGKTYCNTTGKKVKESHEEINTYIKGLS